MPKPARTGSGGQRESAILEHGVERRSGDLCQSRYFFPTWRAAIDDAQKQIEWAYERRRRLFMAAHEAGLSFREIGEAAGMTAAGVHKIVGAKQRATLDSLVNETP